jgi:hypothetical protein
MKAAEHPEGRSRMGSKAMRTVVLAFLAVAGSAVPALAQDDFRHGRIREVEPTVTLQREAEPGSEEAYANSPFLPGDRVWTDDRGRVEFQFPDGATLRLDSRGKLDYLAHDDARGARVVLKLWSGGLYLRTRADRQGVEVEVETPAGVVETLARGVYRIDVDSGETRLSVYEGEASLDGGGRTVRVDAGERTYARRGEDPESARVFDRGEEDDFAAWDREREGEDHWADAERRYLPEELEVYAGELEANGNWRYENAVGYVWQPTVEVGWRPFWRGRWGWTSYGWTWIPHERWGWAPFHYGRWGFSTGFGWYWIPGRSWGPAWVSWASGGDYIGWCPLGHRDRPVHAWGGNRGFASGRGDHNAWNFVRRGDLGARDLSRRRIDPAAVSLQQVRLVESARARPTRDLRGFSVVDPGTAAAVPRGVRTRPTPGDTVPELQVDRQTTIPSTVRPRPREVQGIRNYDRRADPAQDSEAQARRPGRDRGASEGTSRERATDVRSPRSRPAERLESGSGASARRPKRAAPPEREADPETQGRFFRPLSEPRSRPSERREATPSREDTYRPRDESRPRPRSESSADRERKDSGASRGMRSAPPREERSSPPPRVEPRRSEPPRSAAPAPRSGSSGRSDRAASRQERNRR